MAHFVYLIASKSKKKLIPMLDIQKILKKDCTYIIRERVLNLQKDDFGKFYIKKNIAVKKKL